MALEPDRVQVRLCHFLCCVTSDKLPDLSVPSNLTCEREIIIVSGFAGGWKDGLGLGLAQPLKHWPAHSKQSIEGSYHELGVKHLIL